MRVKRYLVDTLPDAVQMIRTELGKDAVILESKEVKVGGLLGMFRKKKIEVLAAVEPNKKQEANKTKLDKADVDLVVEQILRASQKSKDERVMQSVASHDQQSQTVVPSTIQKNVSYPVQEAVPNLLSQTYNSSKQPAVLDKPSSNANANRTLSAENQAATKSVEQLEEAEEQIYTASTSMSKTEQFILKELKHLRLEMKAISQQNVERKNESVNISLLRSHLFDQEINVEWINTLCELLQDIEQHENRVLEVEEVWEIARKQFHEWLLPFSKSTIEQTTRVIQLVGPTGVGKTTTIAKLAAKFSINHNKKIGLITADTYRIAAVEQLRTYANILNIPLEVVFSPLDLTRAYKQLEDCEVIIMDTAGRNFKSDLFVSEVNSLIANTQFSEGVLVVSLTSRTRDMSLVAEKFGKYGVRKVVFTKLDEANAYGSIFNMIMQFGLQPLFVTSGQNVPDDIEPFTIEHYVNLLLGEPRHE